MVDMIVLLISDIGSSRLAVAIRRRHHLLCDWNTYTFDIHRIHGYLASTDTVT